MKKRSLVLLISTLMSVTICFFVVRAYMNTQAELEVVFLDVGQGDAIFITTATGKQVLIDGGAFPDIDVSLANYMSFYDRSIDIVIATHPDLDHIGGLTTVMKRYHVPVFLYSGLHSGISAYRQLVETLIVSDTGIVTAQAGQIIHLDESTYLEVLSPYSEVPLDEPNEKSIATRLVYKETSMLLTGDASKFNEYDMVSVYGASLESEVLKLGHHGSKTSSSELFLDTVRPEFVVVSAGCDNRFSHPSDVVVDRVKIRKIKMLDTCSFGDIVFTSNGTRWKLE